MGHQEFLPLCDVLFNIISLASYFCDVVFDLVMAYALFERGLLLWTCLVLGFVSLSVVASQVVSVRWYLHTVQAASESKPSFSKKLAKVSIIVVHILQLGVLWRYFKLFLPVDLRYVKFEVRDLCMLRLVHAFCQAAPMLLLQLYLLMSIEDSNREFRDLNVVSVSLSLFSVCWALASFSKNVRMHNVHKLVLTWLGVIFQLMWRLGTVSGRVLALVSYALLHSEWVLLVLLLHWVSMFLWLISPNTLFHRERLSRHRKAVLASLVAFVYVFAYVNLQEVNHRPKMVVFYLVMAVENCVLVYSWWVAQGGPLALISLGCFLGGLCFMLLYYSYFHVRRLDYEAGGRPSSATKVASSACSAPNQSLVNASALSASAPSVALDPPSPLPAPSPSPPSSPKHNHSHTKPPTRYRQYGGGNHHHYGGIPGVFNCRFTNPYAMTKRKKKKPTTFVPPPSVGPTLPFWCRPPSQGSEGESVGSGRVDIQRKLREKKEQQLAELRVIEEEMLRGALPPPCQASPQILLAPHRLPYTLPREGRHLRRPQHYAPPANSSDGDVDSGDDNDSECWHTSIPHLPFRLQQSRVRHETKL